MFRKSNKVKELPVYKKVLDKSEPLGKNRDLNRTTNQNKDLIQTVTSNLEPKLSYFEQLYRMSKANEVNEKMGNEGDNNNSNSINGAVTFKANKDDHKKIQALANKLENSLIQSDTKEAIETVPKLQVKEKENESDKHQNQVKEKEQDKFKFNKKSTDLFVKISKRNSIVSTKAKEEKQQRTISSHEKDEKVEKLEKTKKNDNKTSSLTKKPPNSVLVKPKDSKVKLKSPIKKQTTISFNNHKKIPLSPLKKSKTKAINLKRISNNITASDLKSDFSLEVDFDINSKPKINQDAAKNNLKDAYNSFKESSNENSSYYKDNSEKVAYLKSVAKAEEEAKKRIVKQNISKDENNQIHKKTSKNIDLDYEEFFDKKRDVDKYLQFSKEASFSDIVEPEDDSEDDAEEREKFIQRVFGNRKWEIKLPNKQTSCDKLTKVTVTDEMNLSSDQGQTKWFKKRNSLQQKEIAKMNKKMKQFLDFERDDHKKHKHKRNIPNYTNIRLIKKETQLIPRNTTTEDAAINENLVIDNFKRYDKQDDSLIREFKQRKNELRIDLVKNDYIDNLDPRSQVMRRTRKAIYESIRTIKEFDMDEFLKGMGRRILKVDDEMMEFRDSRLIEDRMNNFLTGLHNLRIKTKFQKEAMRSMITYKNKGIIGELSFV